MIISVLLMIGVAAMGPSAAVPLMSPGRTYPVYFEHSHPSAELVTVALWLAVVTGSAGVTAALLAARRGWRPSVRTLIASALIGVAALTVVPPIGSSDMMDYATYGRIAALGHSPYQMLVAQLRQQGDPVAKFATIGYAHDPSPYGPLFIALGLVASRLGGPSAAQTVFWLKLMNALAFLAVALTLDRMLRADPARRIRAHLLWTVNPLVLLATMAGGHMDVYGCLAGLLAIAAFRRQDFRHGLVAGLLCGIATGFKAPFALFAVGIAIASLRTPRALAGVCLGTVATLLPPYLIAGAPGIRAVIDQHNLVGLSAYEPLQLLARLAPVLRHNPGGTSDISYVLSAALLLLLLWRLPAGPPDLPGARPALALTMAWLLVFPQQHSWYAIMVLLVLGLLSAGPFDWLMLAYAGISALAEIPGVKFWKKLSPHWVRIAGRLIVQDIAPVTIAVVILAVVGLCVAAQRRSALAAAEPETHALT